MIFIGSVVCCHNCSNVLYNFTIPIMVLACCRATDEKAEYSTETKLNLFLNSNLCKFRF